MKKTIELFMIVFAYKLLNFVCEPYVTLNSNTIGILLLISIVESIILLIAIMLGWKLFIKMQADQEKTVKIVCGIVYIGSLVLRFYMTAYYPEISLKRFFVVIMSAGEYTIIIVTVLLIIYSFIRFMYFKVIGKPKRQ